MKNKNKFSRNERGQALIIITFAIIGLIGLTGLTVDGGMAYSDRRHAQNAADSAALAAALAHVRETDPEDAALEISTTNGYDDNEVSNNVTVTTTTDLPADACPAGTLNNIEITVNIESHVATTFGVIVGIREMTNVVTATSRACGVYIAPIFGGNAIVSCGNTDENYCSFDGGSSGTADWVIHGGGIASDSCADSKDGDSVTLDDGLCVSAVTGASGGFSDVCEGNAVAQCDDTYLDSIMPPNPCTTPPPSGLDVIKIEHVTLANNTPSPIYFSDGIYCIDDMDGGGGGSYLSGHDIILDNATLYITDLDFSLTFAGGGGFAGTPTESGTYSSYSIIVARSPIPCPGTSGPGSNDAQVIDYRGGSGGVLGTVGLYGTILAPTACIDMRGNAGNGTDELVINSQIIANKVSSNGNAHITINYVDDQNRRDPIFPAIQLLK